VKKGRRKRGTPQHDVTYSDCECPESCEDENCLHGPDPGFFELDLRKDRLIPISQTGEYEFSSKFKISLNPPVPALIVYLDPTWTVIVIQSLSRAHSAPITDRSST